LKYSEVPDACEQLVVEELSHHNLPIKNNMSGVFATESGCDLNRKIINAQEAGFKCIVIISDSEEARVMDVQPGNTWKYKINVSFIGNKNGLILKEDALGGSVEYR